IFFVVFSSPLSLSFRVCFPAFQPSTLACTSDSLVRVSRRVNAAPLSPSRHERTLVCCVDGQPRGVSLETNANSRQRQPGLGSLRPHLLLLLSTARIPSTPSSVTKAFLITLCAVFPRSRRLTSSDRATACPIARP